MKIKFFLFIVVLFSLTWNSCQKTTKPEVFRLFFDVDEKGPVALSEFIESIRIIPLNTPGDIRVSNISKIQLEQDFYFVRSSGSLPSLFIFNKSGDFVSQIRNHGKGPGEFLNITAFYAHPGRDQVSIIDIASSKKLTFKNCGEFVEEEIHPRWGCDSYCVSDNDHLVFYGALKRHSDFMVQVYDGATFQPKNRLLKVPDNHVHFFHVIDPYNFTLLKDEALFWYSMGDKIYGYQNGQFYSKYVIDFGKYNIPSSLFNGHYHNVRELLQDISNHNGAFINGGFGETDRYVFFRGRQRMDEFFYLLFDKEMGRSYVIDDFIDDMLFFAKWEIDITELRLVLTEGNNIYFSIDAHFLKGLIDKAGSEMDVILNKTPELKKMIENIQEDDNPYLIQLVVKR